MTCDYCGQVRCFWCFCFFFFFFFPDCQISDKTCFRLWYSLFSRIAKPSANPLLPFSITFSFFFFRQAFHWNLKNLECTLAHFVAARFHTSWVCYCVHTVIPLTCYLTVYIRTYKCVRPILGKNLEAIVHHFHGINCLDLGKVKT